MVPREAPMGIDSRMAFTIMPMKNDMAATTKGDGGCGRGHGGGSESCSRKQRKEGRVGMANGKGLKIKERS
jgi:hypothetical protein